MKNPNCSKLISPISAVLLSLLIFNLGILIYQIPRFSNFLNGYELWNFSINILWAIFIFPWSLIILTFAKPSRFRTFWVIVPSISILMIAILKVSISPHDPYIRFKYRCQYELPKDISKLEYHYSGDLPFDYVDTYYFETSPLQIHKLVQGMKLTKEHPEIQYVNFPKIPNCPDSSKWNDASIYYKDNFPHDFYFIVNKQETSVYISKLSH